MSAFGKVSNSLAIIIWGLMNIKPPPNVLTWQQQNYLSNINEWAMVGIEKGHTFYYSFYLIPISYIDVQSVIRLLKHK